MDASTRIPGRFGARPGAITLARHGEPALSRKVRFSAAGYGEWWAAYEEGGLKPGQIPPPCIVKAAFEAGTIIASTRRRAVETAQAVAGGRAFAQDPLFIEAPLPPPPWPAWIKLTPRTWGFWSRVWWWFFDHHAGQENRRQAQRRADEAAVLLHGLAVQGQDVLILAHGFFNTMVGEALKARGWRLTRNGGFKYWRSRRYEWIGKDTSGDENVAALVAATAVAETTGAD